MHDVHVADIVSRTAQFDSLFNKSVEEENGDDDSSHVIEEHEDLSRLESDFFKITASPGDLVECSGAVGGKSRTRVVGLVVWRDLLRADVLTSSGSVMKKNMIDLTWSVPMWIDPKELKGIHEYLKAMNESDDISSIPHSLCGDVKKKLADFEQDLRQIYRKHAAEFDSCHSILADEIELRHGTLPRIASELLKKDASELSNAELYATKNAIDRQGSAFYANKGLERKADTWLILPKSFLVTFESVEGWTRDYMAAKVALSASDPVATARLQQTVGFRVINGFAKVAQDLVKKYRTRYQTDAGSLSLVPQLGYSKVLTSRDNTAQAFTPSQTILIRFLELWSFQGTISGPLSSLPPLLIQATGMYTDAQKHDSHTGRMLLQEMGIIPYYFNAQHFRTEAMLPCSGLSASLEAYQEEVHTNTAPLIDSMAPYRHDWGDLRVFCIDPPGTSEVDDGISIEDVPGEPDLFWVRIHVAHPTAFISRSEKTTRMVAALARHYTQTIYCPDTKHAMLPDYLSEYCSVGPGKACLTISAKMDRLGNVLERDVRAGRVHNTVNYAYEELNATFGDVVLPTVSTLIVGAKLKPRMEQKPLQLPPADVENLKLLKEIHLARLRLMGEMGANRPGSLNNTKLKVRVWSVKNYEEDGKMGIDLIRPNRIVSQEYLGHPVIEVSGMQLGPQPMSAKDAAPIDLNWESVVATWMTLACGVAADWAWDRKAPMIFRSSYNRMSLAELASYQDEHLGNVTDPAVKDWVRLLIHTASGMPTDTSRPGFFTSIMAPRYAKVTSPLRRYGDMVNHWQIDSILRLEMETGRSFVTDGSEPLPELVSSLSFTSDAIEAEIRRVMHRSKSVTAMSVMSHELWICHLINRGMQKGECEIPESFCTHVSVPPTKKYPHVESDFLGTKLKSRFDYGGAGYRKEDIMMGDKWETVISDIDPSFPRLMLKPVRLIERVNDSDRELVQKILYDVTNRPLHAPIWT